MTLKCEGSKRQDTNSETIKSRHKIVIKILILQCFDEKALGDDSDNLVMKSYNVLRGKCLEIGNHFKLIFSSFDRDRAIWRSEVSLKKLKNWVGQDSKQTFKSQDINFLSTGKELITKVIRQGT